MKWIRVASRISQDAKIWQLAELAGCDRHKAIGHLVDLWGVMAEEAKEGDLSGVPVAVLESWAGWTGRRGKFAAAVRATLCDERGVVSAWEKYQGAAIREHEADRRRKSGKKPPDSPPDSGGVPPEIPPENNRNSGAYDTKTSTREDLPPSATRVVALVEAADQAVRPRLPADYRPDLDALLGLILPERRSAWLRSMAAKLDGLHPPAVTPVVLGEAIRAMMANGAELSVRLFDGYVRNAAQPPPLRATGTHGPHGAVGTRDTAGARTFENAMRGLAAAFGPEEDER